MAGAAVIGSLPGAGGVSIPSSSEVVAADAVDTYRPLSPNSYFSYAFWWWWFAFTQVIGLLIVAFACWVFTHCMCCRLPRAARRLAAAFHGIYRRCFAPRMVDACAQVELHDLQGTMVPGLKHLLQRFELATSGTRDALEHRIRGAFDGRNRVWQWHLALDAPPRALANQPAIRQPTHQTHDA